MSSLILRLFCVGVALVLAAASRAAPLAFTDPAAFTDALPGPATTLDFESQAAGSLVADGDTVEGITFHYDFGGVQMKVTDVFETTSPTNFLGTDDGDLFLDGDDFDLSFAPVRAIGMFFITADPMFDDDITLTAAGTSVGLSVADAGAELGDGGVPYFLGIVDDASSFSTASITTIGGEFFLYNVDDITTAVPEPGTAVLLGGGLIGLWALGRRPGR